MIILALMTNLPDRIFSVCRPEQIQQLVDSGLWLNMDADKACFLLNEYFPNLNLEVWVKELETLLTTIGTPPISIAIEISKSPSPTIVLQMFDRYEDDIDMGLALQRTITNIQGEISVSHDYLTIPLNHRSKGMSRLITRSSLQQYANMDIRRIAVEATLQNGGYTWARNGFTAIHKHQMETILKKAQLILDGTQFITAKRLFDNYYDNNPGGSAFPIIKWAELPFMKKVLVGTTWGGAIDFKNSNQLLNFITYVNA